MLAQVLTVMAKRSELCTATKEAVVKLAASGQSSSEIARILSLKPRTVRRVVQKHQTTGSVENSGRSGRPRKTSERFDRRLKTLSLADRFKSPRKLLREAAGGEDPPLSLRSTRRRLQQAGLKGCIAAKKPFISEVNRKKRLAFAKAHKDWTVADWGRVLWSDESKFNLVASDGVRYVRRRPGERFDPSCTIGTVKHRGGNIMVWGCMSAAGVGRVYKVVGTMRSDQYIGILQNAMLPSMVDLFGNNHNAIFQHDNDPKHTSRATKQFLADQALTVMDWPPQSPDLNPIENLWEILDHHRNQSRRPSGDNQLWQDCKEAWAKITPDLCARIVATMPERMAAVIKSKGCATKW